jgi:hypothetical protein
MVGSLNFKGAYLAQALLCLHLKQEQTKNRDGDLPLRARSGHSLRLSGMTEIGPEADWQL